MDANYRPVLSSYADFAPLEGLMAGRGLNAPEVGKIPGGNALDLFAAVAG